MHSSPRGPGDGAAVAKQHEWHKRGGKTIPAVLVLLPQRKVYRLFCTAFKYCTTLVLCCPGRADSSHLMPHRLVSVTRAATVDGAGRRIAKNGPLTCSPYRLAIRLRCRQLRFFFFLRRRCTEEERQTVTSQAVSERRCSERRPPFPRKESSQRSRHAGHSFTCPFLVTFFYFAFFELWFLIARGANVDTTNARRKM